jgi:hypothetical protein
MPSGFLHSLPQHGALAIFSLGLVGLGFQRISNTVKCRNEAGRSYLSSTEDSSNAPMALSVQMSWKSA